MEIGTANGGTSWAEPTMIGGNILLRSTAVVPNAAVSLRDWVWFLRLRRAGHQNFNLLG